VAVLQLIFIRSDSRQGLEEADAAGKDGGVGGLLGT
jgi:hypothetical protein